MKLKLTPGTRKGWLRFILVWGFVMFAGLILLRRIVEMPGRSYRGPLPELTQEQAETSVGIERHVRALAGQIGERNVEHADQLAAAATYITERFRESGYEPGDQQYTVNDLSGQSVGVRNIEVEVRGVGRPEEIVIVGAHYDSALGAPGANDNASGVAALLELAHLFEGRKFQRTLRLVAFTNEELPFFWTDEMGSRVYARRCAERGENVVGALVLETIGCYSDEPGSQRYPLLLGFFYPDRGDFIAFVGNTKSRNLVHRCIRAFRAAARFPSEGIAAPAFVPYAASSDHSSFAEQGYQALMLTDTAPYRYTHYHEPTDTPDKVDFERAARVTVGVGWVIADLAGMVEP
jgi:hypothetical protein